MARKHEATTLRLFLVFHTCNGDKYKEKEYLINCRSKISAITLSKKKNYQQLTKYTTYS